MTPIRVESKQDVGGEWAGASEARNLPDRARQKASGSDVTRPHTALASDAATPRRSWISAGLRFVRNAAIGLAVLVALPLTTISVGGHYSSLGNADLQQRIVDVERYRALSAPKDAAITPMQAGMAYRALQVDKPSEEFPMRPVAAPLVRPWKGRSLTVNMFPNLRAGGMTAPAAQAVVEMAAGGYSKEEMEYLRVIAEAPLWTEFDRVASAEHVDMLGGQFVLPFRTDAFAFNMPVTRFADSKELAQYGVLRAAYYVANGQPERAELALRSVVSFGFNSIDNGTTTLDGLVGRVIVGIGADGLRQLFSITHDERWQLAEPIVKNKPAPRSLYPNATAAKPDVDAIRKQLIADIGDNNVPRALRFERLSELSFSTCSSVQGVLFGASDETRAVFEKAKRELARYPSERAYLDLVLEAPNRMSDDYPVRKVGNKLLVGAASAAGMVLGNPRMASCTRATRQFD